MRRVWKETSRVLFQMGRSGQASEEVASDLRLECREFRKNIPGRGNSIVISYQQVRLRNSVWVEWGAGWSGEPGGGEGELESRWELAVQELEYFCKVWTK